MVVFITALSVVAVSTAIIPGFTLALGFLLGGIVSPPDAVSAGAVMKFVKLPKSLSSMLEGESLLNDASSLIIFRFAVLAVATGQFVWADAAISFVWMVFGGVGIGILTGILFMKLHKYLPTDANLDIILSLVTPYAMYLLAEEVHSSGVLAVVSGGLLLSYRRNEFLSSGSRVRGFNVWESFTFILNGLVFMLIGLDLPEITSGLGDVALETAIGYGLIVSGVLIVGRIIMAYGAVIVTLIARNFIKVADGRNPGLRGPFVLGWSGMRGVVSLAAALSIPVELANGTPFPQRNLILFITFVVILTTLVLQGLTLPWIIRKLGVGRNRPEHEFDTRDTLRKGLAAHTVNYLETQYGQHVAQHPALQNLVKRLRSKSEGTEDAALDQKMRAIYLEVLEQQRQWLIEANRKDARLDEHLVRRHLYQIDIEEEKLRYS